jgi:hypothetical protein
VNTPSTITLTELPSVPLDERKTLPDAAVIYFVLAGDTVLYIGQSVSLWQRWLAHHRLSQLNEYGCCRIAWMAVDDAGLLDRLEQACITHFSPMLNSELIPGGTRLAKDGETWVAVRLPDWARDQLQEMAQEEDRSLSSALRRLVLEALPARDKGRDE